MRFSMMHLKGIVAAVAVASLSFVAAPAQATEQEKMLNMIAMQNFMNQQAQAQQAQFNSGALQQAAYNQYWNNGSFGNNNNCNVPYNTYNGFYNNAYNNYQGSGLGNFGRNLISRFRGW